MSDDELEHQSRLSRFAKRSPRLVLEEPPDVLHGPRLDLVLVTVEQLLARAASDGPVPLGFADPVDVLHPKRRGLGRGCSTSS